MSDGTILKKSPWANFEARFWPLHHVGGREKTRFCINTHVRTLIHPFSQREEKETTELTFFVSSCMYMGQSSFQLAIDSWTYFCISLVIWAFSCWDLKKAPISPCILLWRLPLISKIEDSPINWVRDLGYEGTKTFASLCSINLFTSASVETIVGLPNMCDLNTLPYLQVATRQILLKTTWIYRFNFV